MGVRGGFYVREFQGTVTQERRGEGGGQERRSDERRGDEEMRGGPERFF